MKISYTQDFDMLIVMRDATGKDLGFSDFNFTGYIESSGGSDVFMFSSTDGECAGCFNDEGRIHVVLDNHKLRPGKLSAHVETMIPDSDFPDGTRLIPLDVAPLDIELVYGAGDLPSAIEAEAVLPVIKGDPFRYEDFTPQQIETLQSPAIEAAGQFGDLINQINERFSEIVGNRPVETPSQKSSQSPTFGPKVLQWGMIPLEAKPGVVYRNPGWIKLGTVKLQDPWGANTELAGNASISFDLSGVDLAIVESAYIGTFKTNDTIRELEIDRVNKCLVCEDVVAYGYGDASDAWTSVRLKLRGLEDGEPNYLCRDADGVIKFSNGGFLISDPVIQPAIFSDRKFGAGGTTLREIVNEIARMSKKSEMQVQLKSKRRFRCDDKSKIVGYRNVWLTPDSEGRKWLKTRGVARIRIVNKRGMKSRWTVFTFKNGKVKLLT